MKLTAESTVINDNKLNTNIDNAQTTADTATTKADNAQTSANNAQTTANTAVTNAAAAQSTANEAKSVADNTAQYFWFTSSGSDTGAHLSEKTQTQFISNPSGANLLARSNGIAVRDGLTELATFGTNTRIGLQTSRHIEIKDGGMQVYQDNATVMAHIGYGLGNAGTGTAYAPYFTFGTRASGSAVGNYSVAEGYTATASAICSHAEGWHTTASNSYDHAEGYYTTASGGSSHAEGYYSTASGSNAHAEGYHATASGNQSHAEGFYAEANGDWSHAGGYYTKANGEAQTAIGKYNVADTTSLFIIGKGTSSARANAFAVSNTGQVFVNGTSVHSSDRRLKEHIAYVGDEAVDFIDNLKPVHYTKDGESHVGFYAQDVEEADKWDCMVGEMNGYKTLGYMELLAPMVAYIQRLEKRIEELERTIK